MVSWAAWFGWLPLEGTPLAFMASTWTFGIFTLLALFELINDQRPGTPSRKVPVQFGGRILMGGLAGATIGAAAHMLVPGLVAGVVGAVIGTYVGAAVRARSPRLSAATFPPPCSRTWSRSAAPS